MDLLAPGMPFLCFTKNPSTGRPKFWQESLVAMITNLMAPVYTRVLREWPRDDSQGAWGSVGGVVQPWDVGRDQAGPISSTVTTQEL
jgi:hypothetical protein